MVDTQSPSWLSEFWTPCIKVDFVEQFMLCFWAGCSWMCDHPYVLEATSPFYKQFIYKQHPKLAWTNTTRTCVLSGAFKSEISRWMGTKSQHNPIAPNDPCKSKHLHLVLKMVDYPHCSGHVSGQKWWEKQQQVDGMRYHRFRHTSPPWNLPTSKM